MKMKLVQSIKGKILLMGGVAIAASVILGSGGITALNKNSRNNEVLKEINAINVAQSENQSLETSYLYFLDDSYLEKIVKNLSDMENDSKAAKKSASILEKKKLDTVAETIGECKDNYSQIRELASQRGYTSDVGEYQNSLQMMRILQIHLLLSKMISPGWMAAGHPSAAVDRQSKLTEKHIQSLFIREKFRKAEREIISLPESVVTVQDMREKYILVTSVFKKAVKKKK